MNNIEKKTHCIIQIVNYHTHISCLIKLFCQKAIENGIVYDGLLFIQRGHC